jgi:hypothetical protein
VGAKKLEHKLKQNPQTENGFSSSSSAVAAVLSFICAA